MSGEGMTMSKRVATYCRVSSDMQDTACQTPEVEALAAARGDVVLRFLETGSAAKARPVFASVMQAAREGRFEVLVVWSIDRFGRSLVGNLTDLVELEKLGVTVCSVRESWLECASEMRPMMIAMASFCAESELRRLKERTRAGMARVARDGSKSGKPVGRAAKVFDVDAARVLLAKGATQREVSEAMGVGRSALVAGLARAGSATADAGRPFARGSGQGPVARSM
jgi:DNA invertase Pin-like site-specific DNA recombinase